MMRGHEVRPTLAMALLGLAIVCSGARDGGAAESDRLYTVAGVAVDATATNPLIAHFDLSPQCKAFIATRIKVGAPSDIIAIVQSGDKLYSKRKFIEVIEGGCG